MYYVFVISNFVYVKFNFDDVITQDKQVKCRIRSNLNLTVVKQLTQKQIPANLLSTKGNNFFVKIINFWLCFKWKYLLLIYLKLIVFSESKFLSKDILFDIINLCSFIKGNMFYNTLLVGQDLPMRFTSHLSAFLICN
jgi:hypothetical protein